MSDRRNPWFGLLVIANFLVGMVLTTGYSTSDEPKKTTPAESLDDELLKGLGGEKPAKQTTPDAAKTGKGATSELDDELFKGLGGEKKPQPKTDAKSAAGDDPIARLTEQMRQAEELMRRSQPDESLRPKQEEIVRQLEELLKKMRQQQQQQQSSSSNKPQSQGSQERQKVQQPQQGKGSPQPNPRPNESSDELKRRQAEKVDMAKMQETLKEIWGQLPPRLREQMLQSGVEHFVPKYELLIEQYFKTLAERQNGE